MLKPVLHTATLTVSIVHLLQIDVIATCSVICPIDDLFIFRKLLVCVVIFIICLIAVIALR